MLSFSWLGIGCALVALLLFNACSENLGKGSRAETIVSATALLNPDLGPTPSPAATLLSDPTPTPAPDSAPVSVPTNCSRQAAGVRCDVSLSGTVVNTVLIPQFADNNGWIPEQYSSTLRYADIDGDGFLDVCGRSTGGMVCYLWHNSNFFGPLNTSLLSDAVGWTQRRYYLTIGLADISGDGRADLCARAANGILCFLATGSGFDGANFIRGPVFSDSLGYDNPKSFVHKDRPILGSALS